MSSNTPNHGARRAPARAAHTHPLARAVAMALLAAAVPLCAQENASDDQEKATTLEAVRVTAEQIARQALGTSVITADDIERRPPTNDLSELLRTMPGVNLTGNSASGQYGNNRQIDLRGMGPENTLILVDGRPVGSRDSIRMGRSGERNTRGDTNWVPAEAVERIEVLRGPAAARYGSGASGGVINIVTKRPDDVFTGSLSLYGLVPHHGEEGRGERAGFQLSGPLAGDWSFRLYGNLNRVQADSLDLNADWATGVTPPAGREGVRNRDLNALLRWDASETQVVELEAGHSRQGNIYAGDRAVSGDGSDLLTELANAGAETNIMRRQTAAFIHRGDWGFGTSRVVLSYEGTDNTRLNEGLAGGVEGSISTATGWSTSKLDNTAFNGELNIPTHWGSVDQMLTVGLEHRRSRLDDPFSMSQSGATGGGIPGLDSTGRSGKAEADLTALYVEDNIYLGERWTLTPGLRYDHHSQFDGNASPSLNAQYKISETVAVKGGVARAFKAPNLYQSNPNYLYFTMGNGCPVLFPNLGSGCYIMGNADLDPETSINKEIGIEWALENGYHASFTYFHNDYKNKIEAGMEPIRLTEDSLGRVFQWGNAPKAVVQGVEGNLVVPLLGDAGEVLKWNNNITYMIENENKTTNQPLSIIPEYTVNTSLDWRPADNWSFLLTGTFYGKQEAASRQSTTGAALVPDVRDAYNLWGISGRYLITPKVSLGAGVNNLFDKRLFRESNSNSGAATGTSTAATYNEPGRAYFVSMTVGF